VQLFSIPTNLLVAHRKFVPVRPCASPKLLDHWLVGKALTAPLPVIFVGEVWLQSFRAPVGYGHLPSPSMRSFWLRAKFHVFATRVLHNGQYLC
jgi:hypothetical protein